MPSAHAHNPIPFRPPAAERERLLAHAAVTGRAVNALLTQALREYLDKIDAADTGQATAGV